MSERFDYQQQQDDERAQWEEAQRLARLLEEHRKWVQEFNRQEKHNAEH